MKLMNGLAQLVAAQVPGSPFLELGREGLQGTAQLLFMGKGSIIPDQLLDVLGILGHRRASSSAPAFYRERGVVS
jgi:hypothetical protein